MKSGRRKPVKARRRPAPARARARPASDAAAKKTLAQLRRERDEVLEQQKATAEVLKVISGSLDDAQPVFDAIVQSGQRLFPRAAISVALPVGDTVAAVAVAEQDGARAQAWRRRFPFPLTRDYMHAVAILDRKLVDIPDVRQAPADLAVGARNFLASGYRALTVMPMMRGDVAIGVLSVVRLEAGPLSDSQRSMLKTFADQAVIAIENARLLGELRRRTDDLTESLEQQTATSEVLKVISNSPGELSPVFEAILENATRICDARFGTLFRFEGGTVRLVSQRNVPAAFAKAFQSETSPPTPHSPLSRLVATRERVHIADFSNDRAYLEGDARAVAGVELGGIRTLLVVPMFKDEELIGAIGIYRQEARPFSDKQIALVQNFAAQAVIAIENARLLNELRRRTDDLTESLERQTAISEILQVISNSPSDVKPVFDSVAERAAQICEAQIVDIVIAHGDTMRVAATFGELGRPLGEAVPLDRSTVMGRAICDRQPVHVEDQLNAGAEYPRGRQFALQYGHRTILGVPLLREGRALGTILVRRTEVRPFEDKHIALLRTFADQAAIAIENTRLLNELRQRTRDLTESLEQQTATSEVLKVVSSSPGDLAPVFLAMLDNAVRLCDARFGTMFQFDGELFHHVAMLNVPPQLAEFLDKRGPFIPETGNALYDVWKSKTVLHTEDDLASPVPSPPAKLSGARTHLAVPMLKDDEFVGAVVIYRQEVRPFTDSQIELVTNFAAQAVIAIENTRLLKELRQRTDDLSEALEQQTATSEVLGVISSSQGELEPVFLAVLENATRICEAGFGTLWLADGDGFRAGATHNLPAALANERQRGHFVRPEPDVPLGRVASTKKRVHITDIKAEPAYVRRVAPFVALGDAGGARTHLVVPLLKDGNLVGALAIYRQEVRPFTDKQITLVESFAAQAVIAIENARLLSELRRRTDDLSESLQQQTATAEILTSISGSMTDTKPVFEAIVRNLMRLFGTRFAVVQLLHNGIIQMAATDREAAEFDKLMKHYPRPLDEDTIGGRAMASKQVVQVAPVRSNSAVPPVTKEIAGMFGIDSFIFAPMIRGDKVIGAVGTGRREPKKFDSKQIALIKSFADQAVIAIENAKLFNELQKRTEDLGESLQQQTATADVLKVISRSTFDLKTVLDTLLRSAAHLCDADQGTVAQRKGDQFYRTVAYGFPDEFLEYVKDKPVVAARNTGTGRALVEGRVVHIPDVHNDPEFDWPEALQLGGFRTMLGVPMLREGVPVGVLTLTRSDVRPFSEKQIELVATFADQAAIAIENVRLFDEIQDKSRQLEEASRHKSQFLANMSHELRTPLNAILGYTELILDNVYGETPDKMRATLTRVERNGRHLLGLINDVLDLSKIEAGQLSLAIGDYSLKQVVHDVYGAVESLAANKHIGLKVDLPHELPAGRGDERRLTQVLLNLVGNAIKFTDAGEVVISASASNGSFKVAVRDTGPGISHSDQAKIFEEFQQADNSTTKQKGGTGLGLAIARRIMEMHGGRLWVESEVGAGSTFTFTLPVRVEQQARQA